MLVPQEPGN